MNIEKLNDDYINVSISKEEIEAMQKLSDDLMNVFLVGVGGRTISDAIMFSSYFLVQLCQVFSDMAKGSGNSMFNNVTIEQWLQIVMVHANSLSYIINKNKE